MSRLEEIIAKGNRGHFYDFNRGDNTIICADGFRVSVVAGGGMYCSPRPAMCICFVQPDHPATDPIKAWGEVEHDYPGPYYEVEVGFPSERPEPWEMWKEYVEDEDNPTTTVYAYVPVQMVRDLINVVHGGEDEKWMTKK